MEYTRPKLFFQSDSYNCLPCVASADMAVLKLLVQQTFSLATWICPASRLADKADKKSKLWKKTCLLPFSVLYIFYTNHSEAEECQCLNPEHTVNQILTQTFKESIQSQKEKYCNTQDTWQIMLLSTICILEFLIFTVLMRHAPLQFIHVVCTC